MKVVYVSPYPPAPDGIGDYTRQLRLAVERVTGETIPVVAAQDPSVKAELDPEVVRVWEESKAWVAPVLKAVLRHEPDVVHIQHEEALLGQDSRLIRFLGALGRAGIARVVTLHSVYGGSFGVPFWWPPPLFHRALAARAEAIVVHQEGGGRDFLVRQGIPNEKIHVIPHGTLTMKKLPRDEARRQLGLPVDAKVALFMGVIHPKKNIPVIVDAAQIVAAKVPGFKLLIAGKPRGRNVLDRWHTAKLFARMKPGREAGWLDVRPGFIPAELLPVYLGAADVLLFPYNQRYGSASGVFHLALSAGRATICSLSPKFGEAREIFSHRIPSAFAETTDPASWARSIEAMLGDEAMRKESEELAVEGAAASAWAVLGEKYARLYRDIAKANGRAERPRQAAG